MKRIKYISLLIALLLPVMMAQGVTKQITLSYNAADFSYVEQNGMVSISSADLMAVFENDTLAPALPRFGVNVLVAPNQYFDTVTVTKTQVLVQNGIYIAPNTLPIPTNLDISSVPPKRTIVYSDTSYPASGKEVEYTGTHIMDGYKVLSFIVTPFRYDAVNGNLYLSTTISLNIDLSERMPAPGVNVSPQMLHGGTTMREAVTSMVTNTAEMEQLYPVSQVVDPTSNDNFKYEYLIVTADSLKDAFMPLVHWKTTKGVKAGILTVEEIAQNYPMEYINSHAPAGEQEIGSTHLLELQIKYALKDYYNGIYSGLKYVLLGGDENIIPLVSAKLRNYYDNNIIIDNNYIERSTIIDLFYASFSKMNWYENDTINTYNLNISLDINATRLPASTNIEVNTLVGKILEYESNPICETWENDILLCGGKQYGYLINDSIMSEPHYKSIQLLTNYILPNWVTNPTFFFDTGNTTITNYPLNATNFQTELSKGYSFIIEDSHGQAGSYSLRSLVHGYDRIALMNTNDSAKDYIQNHYTVDGCQYSIFRAEELECPRYSIVLTNACFTNYFGAVYKSMSETLMLNSNCKFLAYIGSTASGWSSVDITNIGPSNQYNALFFQSLLNSTKHRLGDALFNAKANLITFANSQSGPEYNMRYDNAYKCLLFSISPLCDPEMPVYLSRPLNFNNLYIKYDDTGLLIFNTGVDSCDICIMSLDDFGESYYKLYQNRRSLTLTGIPNNCSLCITKPGYVPYVINLVDNLLVTNPLYIQNETLQGENSYITGSAFIGRNVINSRPEGAVVIPNGKTTITATDGVVIKNDFKVERGAEFKINIKK